MEKKKIDIGSFLSKNMAWAILVVLVIVFSFISDDFLTFQNLMNLVNQNCYLIVCSIGISFIMMSGSMDLSVGYQMSLIGVITGLLASQTQVPVFVIVIIAVLLGMLLSFINSWLATKFNLPLIVVTLGTMNVYQGISYVISQSRTISGFSDAFKFIGQGKIGIIPFEVLLTLVLFLIMSFVLRRTYFGRYVYAMGGNPEATRLAGINVNFMRIAISLIAGAFVGLATVLLISRIGSTMSSTGPGTEFTVLTGIFLGGISIRGGEGRLSGVLAGVFILALLANGMQLAGLDIYYQYIAKGVIMLFAIGFDIFQMERRKVVKKITKA